MTGPYEDLANAIVLQASKDYRKALKTLRVYPKNRSAKADTDVWLYRRNCSAGDSCRLPLDEGRAPFHAGLPYLSGMES